MLATKTFVLLYSVDCLIYNENPQKSYELIWLHPSKDTFLKHQHTHVVITWLLYCRPRWGYHSLTVWTHCGQASTHAIHIYILQIFISTYFYYFVLFFWDQFETTTPNNTQQHVQTNSTCNKIQRCWELLASNVTSVGTGFQTASLLPTFLFSLGPVTNLQTTILNKTAVALAWRTPQSGTGTITAPQVILLPILALGYFRVACVTDWIWDIFLSPVFFFPRCKEFHVLVFFAWLRLRVQSYGDLYYGGRGCEVLGRVRHRRPLNFNVKQAASKQWLLRFLLSCFWC